MSAGLDRLAELARQEAPPALDAEQATRLVENAMRAAGHEARAPRRTRRVVPIVALALAAAAAVLLWLVPRVVPPAPHAAAPLRFELPTGDRVTATAGTRVQVRDAAASARRLVLADGTALFDVAPLGRGACFEVTTAHARVEVVGTVFSVTTSPARTTVRVYEGHVRITVKGRVVELGAGQTWSSDGPAAEADPLRELATAAAAARAPRVTALPRVEPLGEPTRHPEPPAPPAPPAAVPSVPPAPAPSAPTAALAQCRSWITLGPVAAERARRIAHARAEDDASEQPGEWRLVEADALRALGRPAEAASAYDAAAQLLPRDEAAHAGYLAATLRLERGDDPAGALASLDAAGADAPGAPLEERSLALRALALARLAREAEAAAIAERYLARFPDGGQAAAMRALALPR